MTTTLKSQSIQNNSSLVKPVSVKPNKIRNSLSAASSLTPPLSTVPASTERKLVSFFVDDFDDDFDDDDFDIDFDDDFESLSDAEFDEYGDIDESDFEEIEIPDEDFDNDLDEHDDFEDFDGLDSDENTFDNDPPTTDN
ncbi:MAG: hypothetical protein LBK82_04430 [Planctomycetaceae bacterium]|jgi:hypothetical protein|nr:hypothetical protein [Planctomycetaceae bacterium]